MIHRHVKLPQNHSFFLFGARQTGKSMLINHYFHQSTWSLDLLINDTFFKYSKNPALFLAEAERAIQEQKVQTIFIDEIQRIPLLLNEVQHLMGKYPHLRFIMTGSSARKLKRGGANLLAGRAFALNLFPLIYQEIKPRFDLESCLRFGTLPSVWEKAPEEKINILSSYANVYLREEIQSESIVRNLGSYSRFVDLAASQFGELVSYSTLARETYLTVKTVHSYYQILEDTLIGFRLMPWHRSLRKRLVAHPKFYFFDNGVTNAINKHLTSPPDPVLKGRLFEQWLMLEVYRLLHYNQSEANLFFWRTNHGAEVDLLIEKHGKIRAALEFKSSSRIAGAHLSGLRAFRQEHPDVPCYVVSTMQNPYKIDTVQVLPWKEFLNLIPQLI